jgi:hypothetical protein
MLKWYDHLMVSMFAFVISQGILYNLLWGFVGWVAFNVYLNQRRIGNV